MNLVFAGTPAFAVPSLDALVHAGHRLLAVYTQPDRPAGRGRKLLPGPVKERAQSLGLPVRQPLTLKEIAEQEALAALAPDAMIVVAYGLILPPAVLAIPRLGCINVHASLLPRWRGAAPIERAIDAGDTDTGVTIMQMAAGLDTGPMLARAATPITRSDTAGGLHDRLAALGANLLVETLARLERGAIRAELQDEALASYAAKLNKEEARLDWTKNAEVLHRRIRAFNPRPVAHARFRGKPVRLWEVAGALGRAPTGAGPGEIVQAGADGIHVACGDGRSIVLTRLQLEGGKALDAANFVNGQRPASGERFD